MADHAILSASGSEKWLTCTPSVRLEQQFPEETSEYAAEGTFAHSLAELHLRHYLNPNKKTRYLRELKKAQENPFYSQEMEDHIQTYIDIAIEKINKARARSNDAVILLEQKLDFSPWVPEGFGTGDLVIIADGILEIVDLKYGKGVPVSAGRNTQMRLYGLGAINQFNCLYDFDTVRMTIVQPRLDSISTDEVTVEDLLAWGETYVKPRAEMAFKGEGEFVAGEHCRFCRARFTCRARAEANLELAKYEFREPALLTHEEIAEILFKAEELQSWVTDIKTYALDQAENHGVKFPGWKLVEGRSNRKYADEDAVAQTLIIEGYKEEEIYTKSLLGITAMEKLLGKKRFEELLGEFIIKPPGKPTLVPESDKRPEISSVASAVEDFKENII
jgi:hypothetical protein